MKKIVVLTGILVSFLVFTNCNQTDDKDQMIINRIKSLESAINTHSYENYMRCFDESASYMDSYSESAFEVDYPSDHLYTFSTDITIVGETATVKSTKSHTYSAIYENVFVMIETGDEWYIKTWTEDSSIIFQKKQQAM